MIGMSLAISYIFKNEADIRRKKMKMKTASIMGVRFNFCSVLALFFVLGIRIISYPYSSEAFLVPSRSINLTENSSTSLIIFSDFATKKACIIVIVIAENRPRAVVFMATAIPFARTSAFWAGSAADTAEND